MAKATKNTRTTKATKANKASPAITATPPVAPLVKGNAPATGTALALAFKPTNQPTGPVAGPAPTPAAAAPVASAMAPLFTCTAATWPVKSQGGATIRAYAFKVAMLLSAASPKGFTLAMYKAALVAGMGANGQPITGYTQPGSGWAGHNMPTWASNPKQSWLVPA